MKKFVVLFVFLFAANIFAAETPTQIESKVYDSKSAPNFYVKINPLLFALGNWNIDIDYALTPWLTIGPTFMFRKNSQKSVVTSGGAAAFSSESNWTASNFGLRANIFINGNMQEDGFLISGELGWANGNVLYTENGRNFSGNFVGKLSGGISVAYQLSWRIGLVVNAGIGLMGVGYPEYVLVRSEDGVEASAPVVATFPIRISNFIPNLFLRVGWAI
jgi:hypothetical protein